VSGGRREELAEAVAREDGAALVRLAREALGPVLRYLAGRLYSDDEQAKWRSARALGVVAADHEIVSDERARDLLRRFFWALNDESGTVPYGVPEAIGEILAVRAELQAAFLPLLCAQLTEEDMAQTGPIERGVIWALGRVGPPVARASAEAVAALRRAATEHPDHGTREIARGALEAVGGGVPPR
jgi:methylated-DNA-[protein]-cysteine S-methyltransferase